MNLAQSAPTETVYFPRSDKTKGRYITQMCLEFRLPTQKQNNGRVRPIQP